MNDIKFLALAYNFAAEKHVSQRRKGADAEPYINHPIEVANLLADATEGENLDAVIAAVLHDTIEDTDASYEELSRIFGKRIADIVAEVSDDKSLTRAERKTLEIQHAATASHEAKLVKLADKTANLRSLYRDPPDIWSLERRMQYVTWASAVIAGCRGENARLEAQFDDIAQRLTAKHQAEKPTSV